MIRNRTSALVMAGVFGVAGLGAGIALGPAVASAATTSSTQPVTDRLSSIKNALTGLVKDGTITQAQADKVATTLNDNLPKGGGGHGFGRGPGLASAATVIGISEADLRTALEGGKTVAQVAQGKGIDQATLVSKLVAAEKTRIAAEVKAGRLTQAQADQMTADLQTRITQQVTGTRPPGNHGPRGNGHGDAPGNSTPTPTNT